MAMQALQLTAAISANQLTWAVTSTAAFPPVGTPFVNQVVLCDNEFCVCVGVPLANTIVVRSRGYDGTAATSHDVLANVYTSALAADFGTPFAGSVVTFDPSEDGVISIGQDQIISAPGGNSIFNINKLTAVALTLTAPPLSDNGLGITFTSQTSAAHVITATGLLNDGSVGAPKNTASFIAGKGATIELIAENGLWSVASLQNVVVS